MIASDFPLMSCLIHEPLALPGHHRNCGPLGVADAEFGASVAAEIELGQVPIEVLVVHVLIDADEPALEDREEVLKGIGVNIAARPFVLGMVHGLVIHDLRLVDGGLVGDEPAVFMQMARKRIADVPVIEVHGADVPATLDQGEHHRGRFGVRRKALGLASLGRPPRR